MGNASQVIVIRLHLRRICEILVCLKPFNLFEGFLEICPPLTQYLMKNLNSHAR